MLSRPARTRTRTGEVGARRAPAYTTGLTRKRTTRIERASPEWRPGALPAELRPPKWYARLESNQRPLPSQSSALSAELRAWVARSLRQESNPHLGRTKGACLPLTLRRRSGAGGTRTLVLPALSWRALRGASPTTRSPPRVHSRRTRAAAPQWRRRESNPLLLGASEALCHQSFIPRCGRVESNHHSARRRGYSPLSSPMLSVRLRGDRPDSNRYHEAHNLGCSPLTPRPP